MTSTTLYAVAISSPRYDNFDVPHYSTELYRTSVEAPAKFDRKGADLRCRLLQHQAGYDSEVEFFVVEALDNGGWKEIAPAPTCYSDSGPVVDEASGEILF